MFQCNFLKIKPTTVMNLLRSKRKTLVHIYLTYKYKKNIPHKLGTVPMPFIKHSECTDHKLSADWNEWNTVVTAYIEKLKLYLEDGNSIMLESGLGEFHLAKAKAKKFLDFKKSKENKKQIYFAKNNVDNYFITYSWVRCKSNKKFKWYWAIKLNRFWIRDIYAECEKDFTKIYKLKDSRL